MWRIRTPEFLHCGWSIRAMPLGGSDFGVRYFQCAKPLSLTIHQRYIQFQFCRMGHQHWARQWYVLIQLTFIWLRILLVLVHASKSITIMHHVIQKKERLKPEQSPNLQSRLERLYRASMLKLWHITTETDTLFNA